MYACVMIYMYIYVCGHGVCMCVDDDIHLCVCVDVCVCVCERLSLSPLFEYADPPVILAVTLNYMKQLAHVCVV